jgi:hypothetical protein
MLADFERTGESQIALTDPASRAMAALTAWCKRQKRGIFPSPLEEANPDAEHG